MSPLAWHRVLLSEVVQTELLHWVPLGRGHRVSARALRGLQAPSQADKRAAIWQAERQAAQEQSQPASLPQHTSLYLQKSFWRKEKKSLTLFPKKWFHQPESKQVRQLNCFCPGACPKGAPLPS